MAAEELVLEAGKSPELTSAFETVADAEAGGMRKFTPVVCRDLARAVVCRTYAPAILELCHLVTVAEACSANPRRYEELFWDSGPACARGFRRFVGQRLGDEGMTLPIVTANPSAVTVVHPDGCFAITFARMPFLSALMEFLITVIGYGELDDIWQTMFARGPTRKSVSDAASRLSRDLYGYLKDHLPTVQNHRKFACLIAFLRDHGGGDFESSAIDDEVILEFWLTQSAKEALDHLDFRTFLSVLRVFVRLRQVLEEARDLRALRYPRSIGSNREQGDVDPNDVQRLVESIDEPENALKILRNAPANVVKFLNKTESDGLELLLECGKTSLNLPLSLMRCEVFGAAQARISQAQRRKLPREKLGPFIGDCVREDYQERRDRFDHVRLHIGRMMLASLHVLAEARRQEAITLLMLLRPNVDLRPLARSLISTDDEGKVVPFDSVALRETLMDAIVCPQTVGPELALLLRDARKAFNSLSRRGFSEQEVAESRSVEGFASGVQPLIDISRQLAAFCQSLSRLELPEDDWERQFSADHETFRKQFLLLYGVAG